MFLFVSRYEELEAVEVSQKLEALNGGSNETEKPDVASVASSSNTDSIKTPEEGANPTSLGSLISEISIIIYSKKKF